MDDLVNELLSAQILCRAEWNQVPAEMRQTVSAQTDTASGLRTLVTRNLLTPYQAGRIESGTTFGLVFGAFRVLDRLGVGDQGVIFRGEHVHLRTPVVIKVLAQGEGWSDGAPLARVARVMHPGLVPLLDAGEVRDPHRQTTLRYLVREHVHGLDLETYVHSRGVLPPLETCDLMQQLALILAELHARGIRHGRLKPANVLLTPENQLRLVDIDLEQAPCAGSVHRGQLEWLAPEQLIPGKPIDEKSDLYSLGCLLFWCLIGESLFGGSRTAAEALALRQHPPTPLQRIDPGIPTDLDTLLNYLLAERPEDRPGSAREVADFLLALFAIAPPALRADQTTRPRALVAGTRAETLSLCAAVLGLEDVFAEETCEWDQTLRTLEGQPFDLLLLATRLSGVSGVEMCRRVRATCFAADVPLVVLLEPNSPDGIEALLRAGADDVIALPQSIMHLQRRVRLLLRYKAMQDRANQFHHALLQAQQHPERGGETLAGLDALLLLVSRVAQERQGAANWRGPRLQRYVHFVAEEYARLPGHAVPTAFTELLVRVVPLVDLGLLLVPDEILLSDDPLLARPDLLGRYLTSDAARLLRSVGYHQRAAWGMVQMALDVVTCQQERFDGNGVPARLQGSAIPLAARLVAPCLTYDNLRAPRRYRPAFTHRAALELLEQTWTGAFDPALRAPFYRAAASFTQ